MTYNNQAEVLSTLHGLGLPPTLDEAEKSAWRRWLPGGKLPWHELLHYEEEIGRLEERRRALEEKRAELSTRLQNAPAHDLEALARWQRDGQSGPRPKPSGPQLEAELTKLQQDEAALLRAIDAVAEERVRYVEKHRSRLVEDAGQGESKALERAQQALQELEEAREALVQSRRVRLWAELHPAEEVGREPTWPLLAGARRSALEKLGVSQPVAAEAVFAGLREDLAWISTAASPQQRERLEGSRRATQKEMEQARDRQIAHGAALRQGLQQDARAAELDGMKRREGELAAIKRRRGT